jgi:hypothetical protein
MIIEGVPRPAITIIKIGGMLALCFRNLKHMQSEQLQMNLIFKFDIAYQKVKL